jgi:hypothetical protein
MYSYKPNVFISRFCHGLTQSETQLSPFKLQIQHNKHDNPDGKTTIESALMPTISGFMVVRDAIRQGYPFAEAIASALPVCDEFLVSDGHSTDGTYESLQTMASLNKKIKIYQQEWTHSNLSIIGDLSNRLRAKSKSDYLFYIQAPEIVHEDAVAMLRALPEIFPRADTFCLPYNLVIANFKVQEEFRLRFCRNLERFVLSKDAWTFSSSRKFIKSEATKSLLHPRRLIRYVGRGIDYTFSSYLNNIRSVAVYLPKPIFRYTTLFKENFIERCKAHEDRFGLRGYREFGERMERKEGEVFFEVAAKHQREANLPNYPGDLGSIRTEDHPRIMQELIKERNTINRYYVRDSVLDAIAKA